MSLLQLDPFFNSWSVWPEHHVSPYYLQIPHGWSEILNKEVFKAPF